MDANAVSVLDIFEKKQRLEVPLFQRQYVWNQEHQWAPLWEDISRKLSEYLLGRKDGPVHFLGAMVLDQKQTPITHVDKRQVIDGQQRLTTLQIFLAALKDFCHEHSCPQAEDFDGLTKNRIRANNPIEWSYKVWPTQRDREQFRDVMDAGSRKSLEQKHPLLKLPRKRKYEPRPRMVEAYIFFYGQIAEFFLGTIDEKPLAHERPLHDRLDEVLNALRAALQVVVIDLGHDDDAQVIFETLNARGEPLLPADLLRNYIFLRAARLDEPQESLYEQYWKPFDDPFWRVNVRQGRLIRPRSDLFMQHYLSSRQFNDVPVSHLFVEYKHWIHTKKPFLSVAAELEALANARQNYKAFIAAPAGTALGDFGQFLETFDVGTMSPLMLIITEAKPTETEWKSILVSLESYILRRTVCGLPTKAYNRIFLALASNLAKDGVSSLALLERMSALSGESSLWPSDADFSDAFRTRLGYTTFTQARLVYVLKRTFEALYSSKTEVVTIKAGLTVEHIMPQKWQDHWLLQSGAKGMTQIERWQTDGKSPEALASQARDGVIQRIGNLTLLTQQLNSAVSNGPWKEKRQEIAKYSILPLNQIAAAVDVWDEDSIAARANLLLSAALKTWPGPMSSKAGGV